MADWTESQRNQMIEDYWTPGNLARCPKCHAIIQGSEARNHAGYTLGLVCPHGCGGFHSRRNDDPKVKEFRKWTDEEKAAIVAQHSSDRSWRCPVDGALIRFNDWGAFCPRCEEEVKVNAKR